MTRVFALFALVSFGAMGSAWADDIELSVMNKVLSGRDQPSITLGLNKALTSGTLTLEVPGQKPMKHALGKRAAGDELKFPIDLPPGQFDVSGKLVVTFADGATGELPLQFTVLVAAPMTISAPSELLDLERRTVVVRVSRPAQYCDYQVTHEGGVTTNGRAVFGAAAPGSDLPIRWGPPAGVADAVVLKIRIECFDVDFFTNGIELFPWSLVIEHEEVLFASGSPVLEASEEPKIDVVLDEIRTAVARYGEVIPIGLYITGHTDTVGQADANMTLSLGRAQSIARYFAKQSLGIPIYYTGDGESGLAVPTADEVSEPRNRRASYILNNVTPPGSRWRKAN